MEQKDWSMTIGERHEKGKLPIPINVIIPAGQIWLYYKLDRQEKILGNIRSSVTFMGIILILSIIFAACSALGIL